MYSDVFCKVYNELGWNYYPEAFGQQLLQWLQEHQIMPKTSLDLACGTGILCQILHDNGVNASGMDFSAGMIDIAKANCPDIHYDVADMITYRPDKQFDLVTCTGDALNHILDLQDVEQIFRNVYAYLAPGGYFIFDILNENEVSGSEPFEMDFSETVRVWFQMEKSPDRRVTLRIRVSENGQLQFEEAIHETIHDPSQICRLLKNCGFTVIQCADHLLDQPENHGTTWFLIARK